MTLTEFVDARLSDQEATARRWLDIGTQVVINPLLVLAQCAAARRIIAALSSEHHMVVDDCWYTCGAATEELDGGEVCDDLRRGSCDCGRDARVTHVLELLAQPYAEHPDFDVTWRNS